MVAQYFVRGPIGGLQLGGPLQFRQSLHHSSEAEQVFSLPGEDLRQQREVRWRVLYGVIEFTDGIAKVVLPILTVTREDDCAVGLHQSPAVVMHVMECF